MHNAFWRLVIIIAVVGGCLWAMIPPSETIRLGRDLSGGVSLVYSVRMPEDANRRDVLEQTIAVLNDRVNPQGVLDIAMTPLGTDRIEIVMPLPNEEVKALQTAFRTDLDALVKEAEVRPADLDRALADGTAVTRFGGGGERAALVGQLQQAWTQVQEARSSVEAAGAEGGDALSRARQKLADARISEEDLRNEVLALSLDRSRVLRVLDLSDEPEQKKGPDGTFEVDADGKPVMIPSPRKRALEQLELEFPAAAEQLQKTEAAWAAYQARRTGLDDPEDLKRLLKGAGVLEYHIAVQSDSATGVDVDDMRRQLAERGPANTDSPIAAWYKVFDLNQWADTPAQIAAAEADPASFFGSLRQPLIAAERDGSIYLLLYTDQQRSMTHNRGTPWSLESTGRTTDELGRPAVSFRLDTNGGKLMGRLTNANVNRPMAIVLDGQVYSSPNIQSTISTSGIISGQYTNEDLVYLMRVLAAGSLEARLSPEPIAMSTLGPSIGADNLTRGLDAFLWAVIVVGVFMVVWYFFAGLVADMALLFNGLIIFGVMAMMQGTFTLPGLAGVVLTMGMAVDANVLIYERIREEIESGARDLREAVRNGYGRVFATIVDANVTNLIVCMVLLLMEPTTEVKGFALTLTIGIVATLFTALYCTRYVFDFYVYILKGRRLSMAPLAIPAIGRALRPTIDWVGLRPIFWSMSAIAIIASIVLFQSRGADMFDTEFRGGVSVTMQTARNDEGTALLLPQSGTGSVEDRVASIGANAGDGEDLDARVRREFANARVLTVGDQIVDASGRTSADAFQVKVAAPAGLDRNVAIQDIVQAALLEEFGDQLDVSPARHFEGAGGSDWATFTQPIDVQTLGEALPSTNAAGSLKDFQGGVLLRVVGIDPPIELDEVHSRIDRIRQDPDYADTVGRDVQVFGLEQAAGGKWSDVAVAVLSPDMNYLGNEASMVDERVAAREWGLLNAALTRQSSFEQVSSFAPSVAATRTANAIGAVVLSLAGILFYIWLRFGSFRYSLAAIAALCHDVIIVLGALALTGVIAGRETIWEGMLIEAFQIDTGIVAALLTVIGYSLNDTIVILDRIRENRGRRPIPSREIVNRSINQTFSRTLLTSVTTLIAVLIIYIFGGTGIRGFAFALVIGVAVGTYSSIAIASPLVFRREPKPEDPVPSDEPSVLPAAS
ncbi:MAG: protein translocase subunit SecD [Phycisphaerales bacterium]|nr:protein translocase subunit SecD [Phycisphaerales bacterium]